MLLSKHIASGLFYTALLLVALPTIAKEEAVAPNESQSLAQNWCDAILNGHKPLPFSFRYAGQSSGDLLPKWQRSESSDKGDKEGVSVHTLTWYDQTTGLECRMELQEFAYHPAIEWVLHFRNRGNSDTPILEDVQPLDVEWQLPAIKTRDLRPMEALVYRSKGSTFKISDFQYIEDQLAVGETLEMNAGGGRSSQNWLPFINTDLKDFGVITGIGWTGQWACSLSLKKGGLLRMRAGMEKTHLKLLPGEEIRTPSILQLFWKGDRIAGHNQLRRFILEQHTPHIEGKPLEAPFSIAHWGGMKTEQQVKRLEFYRREGLSQKFLWCDAGWYGANSTNSPDEFTGDWPAHVGDWRVSPQAHPQGLKPLTEAVHAAGMRFMLWLEPERAKKGTEWPKEHPDWFIGSGDTLLLNLAKPEVVAGAIEKVSKIIKDNDVAIYRQDFNMEPLKYWQENDAPDRQGATEAHYIAGLYAFWDGLLARHPGLIIDNCASGGRRLDLEAISRSIALWRSDWQCYVEGDPVGGQVQGMGLSYWIPLHGVGTWATMPTKERCSTYHVRSNLAPAFQLSCFARETQPILEDYPWDWFRQMSSDYLKLRPLFTGDYYPMSNASPEDNVWAAYQMDRPDIEEGFVMAFRRKEAALKTGVFQLKGIDPAASYEVEDADAKTKVTLSGKDLIQGLSITLPEPESSALFIYKKMK